jgi:hypothetical protein
VWKAFRVSASLGNVYTLKIAAVNGCAGGVHLCLWDMPLSVLDRQDNRALLHSLIVANIPRPITEVWSPLSATHVLTGYYAPRHTREHFAEVRWMSTVSDRQQAWRCCWAGWPSCTALKLYSGVARIKSLLGLRLSRPIFAEFFSVLPDKCRDITSIKAE